MEKEKLESVLIDYIDGNLSESERHAVELELTKREDAYRLYEQLKEILHLADKSSPLEPSVFLQPKFNQLLKMLNKLESIVFPYPPIYNNKEAEFLFKKIKSN